MRRLRPLGVALIAVIAFILCLTWAALQAQVALAGFLNGESVWSKAQKDVAVDLMHYAGTGDPADYADIERGFVTLDAFRTVRDRVVSGHFNYADAEAELERGHAMVIAIPGVIFMFDHFANAPYMRQALALWRSTDGSVAQLRAIGTELHRAYAQGSIPAAEVARQRARIVDLNNFIAPRSAAFSLAIANGAVRTGQAMFAIVALLATAAIALWLLMARRALASMRGSEERYRLLFDSAPDAIVMVDERDGRILDANRTAGAWTGRDPAALLGTTYAQLFEQCHLREVVHGASSLDAVDDDQRPVETQSSTVVWSDRVVRQATIRDISERLAGERARRIAAEALANIAEGVLIADADRRVVTANAAASRIAGAPIAELVGQRFDATRRLAEDAPLSADVWAAVAEQGYWSGEVLNRRRDNSVYPERLSISAIRGVGRHILHYVAVFSDISAARADRQRLEQLATRDALTELTNRAEFQRQCDAALRRAGPARRAVAVLFIDLDAFKFVNDSYSHAVGDRLLVQVGERIRGLLRAGEIAGRIGGDEFTVLLPDLASREDAAPVAERLLAALSEPFQVGDYEIAISASIGIAGFPLDGDSANALVANADAAMYVAKSEERDVWRFYAPMMQASAHYRMALATELRQALANNEFHVVYQPSVEMKSGRVVAAEALLRWRHPERGEILPGEFVAVAEAIGLIQRIDGWVMQEVCRQIHQWNQMDMPPIRVAVNVSARWFGHPGFIDSVRRALREHAIAPERIVLEITEGAMLRLGEETESTMRALGAMGLRVAIDDFGTGYASMAYLKLPAVAYLKIDQSFVSGLPDDANDAAITHAMLAMANSLGLGTIAEGVETEAHHEFLQRAGCLEGQGYLYSYPLQPAALERMLRPRRQQSGARLKLVPPCRSSNPAQ